MKVIAALSFLACCLFQASAAATNDPPVKLAIISGSPDVATVLDVLTAELTKNNKVQLLERADIEKVYREQGMSTANGDDLKLGRMLGADGLLLLNVVRTPQATNLTARLAAVKPGVVLVAEEFSWPMNDTTDWSSAFAKHLALFLPKLAVLVKDAIPISVVNLRSAIQSDAAKEAEQALKLLTIQRLSQESQFFVLERQRMQLLSEEKDLKSDESPFWNGSYLLEGVVDQNGYSKDVVTINARLTPPKGGQPLLFEVSGDHTNLAEVVNLVAAKVAELLKVNSTLAKSWNAADEAAQYFDEATWALRWGNFTEAQAAADSAWALGKQDMDCAVARVKAYEAPLNARRYQKGVSTNPGTTNEVIEEAVQWAAPNNTWGLRLHVQDFNGTKSVEYVYAYKFPDPADIDLAIRALEVYHQFSRNTPEGLLKVASEQSNRKNSEWYDLGIEDLVAASTVLQHYNFVPEAQKPVGDKLAELRRSARMVADWISQSPSVHDSYFVGDHLTTDDELESDFTENLNIFRCKVSWSCYWQEKPDDAIALYRELIGSPVFCYIHTDFWLRELQNPRLVAWNQTDQGRIPILWDNFLGELKNSTNLLWQLEAEALALADADNDKDVATSFTNLFQTYFENRDVLVNNPVDVVYIGWRLGDLVSAKTGNGVVTDQRESLNQLFYQQHYRRMEAMQTEYWNKTVPALRVSSAFQQQKQYLKENKVFDFFKFTTTFELRDYSQSQATEIQPLVVAYKSNLLAQSQSASGLQKNKLMVAISQVGFLENDVNRMLNPPAPKPLPQANVQVPAPATVPKITTAAPAAEQTPAPELITNVITVNQAFTIPVEQLMAPDGSQRLNDETMVTVTAHHWCEGKLLLDIEYNLYFAEGNMEFAGQETGLAIAVFDPATKHWEVIATPKADGPTFCRYYNRTILFNGSLYFCDGGQTRKYDFGTRQWQTLKISDGNDYELFSVGGHLYAANWNAIVEIIDGGNGTRVLASSRRRPPVSVLDTQDIGSTPVLFEGPNHSLRVCAGSKIFTFTGNDWGEDVAIPPASIPPEDCPAGMLFRFGSASPYEPASLSFLPKEATVAELYLWQKKPRWTNPGLPPPQTQAPPPKSLWEMPPSLSLINLPAAVHQSGLYLLADHSQAQIVSGKEPWAGNIGTKYLPKNGYEATLLCYSKDFPLPQKVYLNFEAPDSCQPLTGSAPPQITPDRPPVWMLFSDNYLVFGLEKRREWIGMPNRIDVGGKASIWLMPISQIEAACAPQRQILLDQKAQVVAAVEQVRKNLLLKYDLNHDGIIDSKEREAALADTNFIESELDAIDANHNGWLDASELAYFDANHNKTLEPKEQVGIDIAQHLFAIRLMNKFDADGDGRLNQPEFTNLLSTAGLGVQTSAMPMNLRALRPIFPDDNHDGYIDLPELEAFLKQQTRKGLRAHGMPIVLNQMGMNADQPLDPQRLFKAAVEAYWQNDSNINQRTQTDKGQ
jgi:Ca2+-binding EF-hand superfamily protein/curli biogenesis system outer membrane secretion channel CsgG